MPLMRPVPGLSCTGRPHASRKRVRIPVAWAMGEGRPPMRIDPASTAHSVITAIRALLPIAVAVGAYYIYKWAERRSWGRPAAVAGSWVKRVARALMGAAALIFRGVGAVFRVVAGIVLFRWLFDRHSHWW